ncbi:type 4b pilus protein PilO2, partial [Massilia sp. CT11-108]|uniref:type 4b pilus protein PilO2 n=1 Tax=Massilia sp. CT11-108 TaxID=3393900 RepID=UPI0039A68EE7
LALAALMPPPWGGKPTPTSLARACVDGLGHLAAGGWLLDEYVCTADTASYAWSRHGSTLDLLRAEVPDAVFDLGGEKATLAVPLRLERRPPEALLERRALMEPIISELQHMGIAFRIASVPPAAATQQAQTQTRPPAPQWQAYSFSCDSQGLLPTALAELLDRPGVRIDRIVNRAGHWSIEGVMYVK